MVRNLALLVCIWLVYCISQGLGEKPFNSHYAVRDSNSLHSENIGHLSLRGQQLHNLYKSRVQARSQKIIFTCNRNHGSGGLGDRLKGFVSTYILAVLLNAEFAVDWETPFPIGKFYNSTAAEMSESDLLSCQNHTDWRWLNLHTDVEKLNFLRRMDFATEYSSSDCVSVYLNGAVWNHFTLNDHFTAVAASYNLLSFSKREIFQLVMDIFFVQPMPDVLASIQQNHEKLHRRFRVGVQMRFGGVWGDPQRYEGSSVEILVSCFARQTLAVCLRMGSRSDCSVFLTSDSPEGTILLKDTLERHGLHVFTSTGESVHIDKSALSSGMSDHIKTYADWETLRGMDKLVCSRSGYGETASWAGNVPAAILKSDSCCFTDEGVEVPEGADPHYPEGSLKC